MKIIYCRQKKKTFLWRLHTPKCSPNIAELPPVGSDFN